MDIIERAKKLAATARPAVQGQHGSGTTFALAVSLVHGFGLDQTDALAVMLEDWNHRCMPPWSEADLARKVREAAAKGRPPAGKTWGWLLEGAPAPDYGTGRTVPAAGSVEARACFNPEALRAKYVPEFGQKKWWTSRSPVQRPAEVSATAYLDAVFRPGDKVLVCTSKTSQGDLLYWVGRGWFRLGNAPGIQAAPCDAPTGGPEGVWYLSNPVTGKWACKACRHEAGPGVTGRICAQHGTAHWNTADRNGWVLSRRAEANVADFRHLVLEHDPPEHADKLEHAQLWVSFLAQLPMPIVSIANSGGKSFHAVIRLEAATKRDWDELRSVCIKWLVPYGADPRAIRAVQLTRLPNCMRGSQNQELLYLDPAPDDEPVAGWKMNVGGQGR
jgi:hypothetical protein